MKTTELYPIEIKPRDASTQEEDLAKLFYQEQVQLGCTLGLDNQATMSAERFHKLKRSTILTSPLSESERAIWTDFFPRIYSDIAYQEEDLVEPNRQWGSLRDYARCVIPAHILCQIGEWRAANVFDAFEIRAQAIHNTAALFGYQDGKMWLLARWSEDDDPLISSEEVTKIVKGWSKEGRLRQVAVSIVLLLMSLVSFWEAFALHAWVMVVFGLFGFVVGIGAWNDEGLGPSKGLRQALKRA